MNLLNLLPSIINLLTFLSISVFLVSCNTDVAYDDVTGTNPDGPQRDIPEFIMGVPFDPSGDVELILNAAMDNGGSIQ